MAEPMSLVEEVEAFCVKVKDPFILSIADQRHLLERSSELLLRMARCLEKIDHRVVHILRHPGMGADYDER